MHKRHSLRLVYTTLIVILILSSIWIVTLVAQPVHIPILQFSREYSTLHTKALSGVKGQTFVAPSSRLSRIDVWANTDLGDGEYARVKFEIIRDTESQESLFSGVVVFDRSGDHWQARLVFPPDQISKGDRLYIRLESVLSSPRANLYFEYFPRDLYADGNLLELDRLEVAGQDLRLVLYRSPTLPKPLAWAEAAIAPAVAAARESAGPSDWVVALLIVITLGFGAALLVGTAVAAAQILTLRHRRYAASALAVILTALAMAIVAGAEAPIAKLWVPLA